MFGCQDICPLLTYIAQATNQTETFDWRKRTKVHLHFSHGVKDEKELIVTAMIFNTNLHAPQEISLLSSHTTLPVVTLAQYGCQCLQNTYIHSWPLPVTDNMLAAKWLGELHYCMCVVSYSTTSLEALQIHSWALWMFLWQTAANELASHCPCSLPPRRKREGEGERERKREGEGRRRDIETTTENTYTGRN